ncbi:MAG: sigma-54-dependent Fis family transcriptional regulator, partial [Gemmatimonadetes bacterium]|nr:sigma-54-dependent Fis family transcriptional regulator [Gemmatimonadota bacterium]
MNRNTRSRILALVPETSAHGVREGAAAVEMDLELAPSAAVLLDHLRRGPWTATLLSLAVPLVDEALAVKIAAEGSAGALLLSSPGASLEAALLAERAGAVALLHEPLSSADVADRLRLVLDEGKEVVLSTRHDAESGRSGLVGESRAMAEVFEMIAKVAKSTSTVLITGESGTGKELVARALHEASDRHGGSFVTVNCAAIPEHLLESELFGHEKGAFTGAVAQRRGRFERADGGTLFLDEIGDMSLVLQAKMLRALEERTVERVGAESTTPVDVRIIAATNSVLVDSMADGTFREDLYYRLGVVEISMPPLRERGGDVRRLALHFAAGFAKQHKRPIESISEHALARLEGAPWPGNVRELRNVLDRAVLLTSGSTIRSGTLRLGAAAPRASSLGPGSPSSGYPATASLGEVEEDHIRRV